MRLPFRKTRGIAVIEMSGTIGDARTRAWDTLITGVLSDRRFGAAVIEIDSPGGGVGPSGYLHTRVEQLARAKPVVAFIRGLGASGGYMLACGAQKIVAQPSSLIGSIGVISVRPVLQDLMHRAGVGLAVYKGGRLKDMGGFWRPPTQEEEAKSQALVEEIYAEFVSLVAKARKLDEAKVREAATGEVYTARRARELGLVDEVGDLERAVDLAAELGQIKRNPIRVRPRRTLLERLTGTMSYALVEEISGRVESAMTGGYYYMAPPGLPK